mmetsp:Transcript_8560/g.6362  ORF Transcript_8560/g.6362 Transcript_8560/m.6362 type:complete len:115 (+) Transcript_8560:146-490(+)
MCEQLPIDKFYEKGFLERLFSLANQLETRSSFLALDTLRNLITQSFLIEKESLGYSILKMGYFEMLFTLIDKALKLLSHEKARFPNEKNLDLYRLVIEQVFVNLTELFKFAEQG